MNKKQFEIWEKQKRREYSIELSKLQEDFASRGLAISSGRIKAEEDLKAKFDSEIEIECLDIETDGQKTSQRKSIIDIKGDPATITGNKFHFFNRVNIENSTEDRDKNTNPESETWLSKFKKEFLIALFVVVLVGGSAPWWFSPLNTFVQKTINKIFVDYNDPSKILNESIFSIVNKMEKLSTDLQKENFIENYSGLRTRIELGSIGNIKTSSASLFLVELNSYDWYNGSSKMLMCEFGSKWKQKLSILESENVDFIGIVANYDSENGNLLLSNCSLLR